MFPPDMSARDAKSTARWRPQLTRRDLVCPSQFPLMVPTFHGELPIFARSAELENAKAMGVNDKRSGNNVGIFLFECRKACGERRTRVVIQRVECRVFQGNQFAEVPVAGEEHDSRDSLLFDKPQQLLVLARIVGERFSSYRRIEHLIPVCNNPERRNT